MIDFNKQSHTLVTPMNYKHITKSIIQIQTCYVLVGKQNDNYLWLREAFLLVAHKAIH